MYAKTVVMMATIFVVLKGIALGTLSALVIANGGISALGRSVIVAVTSAVIGAIGVIGAAWVTSRQSQERHEQMMEDLKRAQGLTRRVHDPDLEPVKPKRYPEEEEV